MGAVASNLAEAVPCADEGSTLGVGRTFLQRSAPDVAHVKSSSSSGRLASLATLMGKAHSK
jgi:hypothetical protein